MVCMLQIYYSVKCTGNAYCNICKVTMIHKHGYFATYINPRKGMKINKLGVWFPINNELCCLFVGIP